VTTQAGRGFTVYGAGAIGGMLAAYLAHAGHDVTLTDPDDDYLAALGARGLRVVNGAELRAAPRTVGHDRLTGPLPAVLLAVKGIQTGPALARIAPLLADDGYVASFQNGLAALQVAEAVGPSRAMAACFTFGGLVREPGLIVSTGPGEFYLGEVTGPASPRAQELAAALAGFHHADLTQNIMGHLWAKLAVAAAWAAATLSGADVDVVLADPRYQPALGRIVGEVARVAAVGGVRCERTGDGFDPVVFAAQAPDPRAVRDCWQAQLAFWAKRPDKRTGIWRDLAVRRRPTEVWPLYAPVVERAERHAVAVPGLRRLMTLYRAVESGTEAPGWGCLDALADCHPGEADH
jgi:2-dehydropantoate 2-reductase